MRRQRLRPHKSAGTVQLQLLLYLIVILEIVVVVVVVLAMGCSRVINSITIGKFSWYEEMITGSYEIMDERMSLLWCWWLRWQWWW
jgi:hypothetical protein